MVEFNAEFKSIEKLQKSSLKIVIHQKLRKQPFLAITTVLSDNYFRTFQRIGTQRNILRLLRT